VEGLSRLCAGNLLLELTVLDPKTPVLIPATLAMVKIAWEVLPPDSHLDPTCTTEMDRTIRDPTSLIRIGLLPIGLVWVEAAPHKTNPLYLAGTGIIGIQFRGNLLEHLSTGLEAILDSLTSSSNLNQQ